jgi:hypothetical protein
VHGHIEGKPVAHLRHGQRDDHGGGECDAGCAQTLSVLSRDAAQCACERASRQRGRGEAIRTCCSLQLRREQEQQIGRDASECGGSRQQWQSCGVQRLRRALAALCGAEHSCCSDCGVGGCTEGGEGDALPGGPHGRQHAAAAATASTAQRGRAAGQLDGSQVTALQRAGRSQTGCDGVRCAASVSTRSAPAALVWPRLQMTMKAEGVSVCGSLYCMVVGSVSQAV